MNCRIFWMVVVTLLDISFLWGQSAPVRFDAVVRNDFFAGLSGDEAALTRAMQLCEKLIADDPEAAEPMVWHGSGLMYRSGMAFRQGDTAEGMKLYVRALDEMEQAVKLQPENPGVLVPRGATLLIATIRMNGNPQRDELIRQGLADYLKVLALQKETFATFGTHPRGQLLLGIADAYSRLNQPDQARPVFERIQRELPGTEYATRAGHWLQNGTLTANEENCTGCHVSH